MNVVVLSGRLARDPELRMIGEKGIPTAFFTLAVDRDGEQANFISCKLVGDRAENFCEYNKKGRALEIRGQLQTWIEGESSEIRDRYIVKVDWFKAGAKPRGHDENTEGDQKPKE